MIAADSSIWVAYLQQERAPDLQLFHNTLITGDYFIPPAIIAELCSASNSTAFLKQIDLNAVPMVDGAFWRRAGSLRNVVRSKGFKANMGDALVAQSCIDHNVPLLTRDMDFRHFEKHCGLKLVKLPKH